MSEGRLVVSPKLELANSCSSLSVLRIDLPQFVFDKCSISPKAASQLNSLHANLEVIARLPSNLVATTVNAPQASCDTQLLFIQNVNEVPGFDGDQICFRKHSDFLSSDASRSPP